MALVLLRLWREKCSWLIIKCVRDRTGKGPLPGAAETKTKEEGAGQGKRRNLRERWRFDRKSYRGMITNSSGKPIRGAMIQATDGPKTIARFSQKDGRYEIAVPAGKYDVSA